MWPDSKGLCRLLCSENNRDSTGFQENVEAKHWRLEMASYYLKIDAERPIYEVDGWYGMLEAGKELDGKIRHGASRGINADFLQMRMPGNWYKKLPSSINVSFTFESENEE